MSQSSPHIAASWVSASTPLIPASPPDQLAAQWRQEQQLTNQTLTSKTRSNAHLWPIMNVRPAHQCHALSQTGVKHTVQWRYLSPTGVFHGSSKEQMTEHLCKQDWITVFRLLLNLTSLWYNSDVMSSTFPQTLFYPCFWDSSCERPFIGSYSRPHYFLTY